MKNPNRALTVCLLVTAAATLGACSSDNSAPEAPPSEAQEAVKEVMEPAAEEMASTDAPESAEAMMDVAKEDVMADMDHSAMDMPAAAAAPEVDGDPCSLSIEAGDSIAYSTYEMSVPSSCSEVSLTFTHTGKMAKNVMGHNWVLMAADAVQPVAMAGMTAGLAANYLPAGDERVVAATKIIGGGESDTISFSLDALAPGASYVYVCTFPGHWGVMKGTFTVTE